MTHRHVLSTSIGALAVATILAVAAGCTLGASGTPGETTRASASVTPTPDPAPVPEVVFADPDLERFEYRHYNVCERGVEGRIGGTCEKGSIVDHTECVEAGAAVDSVDPVQRRLRGGGSWEYVALYTCPGELEWVQDVIGAP